MSLIFRECWYRPKQHPTLYCGQVTPGRPAEKGQSIGLPPPFKECDISPSGKISITLSKAWFPHLGGDAGFICRLNLPLPASAAAQNVALCESAWSNDGVGKIRGSEPKLKNNAANYARKIGTRRSRLPAAIAAACAYFKEQGEKASAAAAANL